MSGLIKQFVGTLGILLVMVGYSHAQNAPTQPTEGGGALSTPNQAVDSQNNIPPTVQPTLTPPATTPAAGTAIAPATAPSTATVSGQNTSVDTPQAPIGQNSAPASATSQNAQLPSNNGSQENGAQTVAPANNLQNSQANQATGNQPVQPLPPVNSDGNTNLLQSGQSDANAAPVGTETAVGVDKSTLPHDLSPYGMFMQADWVVKTVMIGLAMASLLTWIIFVAKTIELSIAKAKVRNAVREIVSSHSLSEAIEKFANKKNVSGRLINAAANEVRMSINAVDGAGSSGVKERVTSALSRIEAHAGRRMAGGSAILATIGSISPFVGLFGTVWGIMNAFIGISKSQVTNLAVVAPGIAEALLATAIGLVAAIPAVVIYNYLAKSIIGYRQIVTDASTGIERLVSRDLDFREAQRKSPRPIQPLAAE
ncbi:tonB-system energizer ExbB [Bartonella sp. HY328]|nr:tonB-system energizer ExbB [Bartonella sp. HY328]UXN09903.1 tonB-system energizer ExbB [Bartonella sp. HY328]